MKYASEVIDLMGCMPGRRFKVIEIVRHVVKGKPNKAEWERVRRGVRRVLEHLEEAGVVESDKAELVSGGSATYAWKKRDMNFCKAGHELLQSGTESGTISASPSAPIGFERSLIV